MSSVSIPATAKPIITPSFTDSPSYFEKRSENGELICFFVLGRKVNSITVNGIDIDLSAVNGLPNGGKARIFATLAETCFVATQCKDRLGKISYQLKIVPKEKLEEKSLFIATQLKHNPTFKAPQENALTETPTSVVQVSKPNPIINVDEFKKNHQVHFNAQIDIMLGEFTSKDQTKILQRLLDENDKLNVFSRHVGELNQTSNAAIKAIVEHIFLSIELRKQNIKHLKSILSNLFKNVEILSTQAYVLSQNAEKLGPFVEAFLRTSKNFQTTVEIIYTNSEDSYKFQEESAQTILGKLLKIYKVQVHAAENVFMKVSESLVPSHFGPVDQNSRFNLCLSTLYRNRYKEMFLTMQNKTNQYVDLMVDVINTNNKENSSIYLQSMDQAKQLRHSIDSSSNLKLSQIKSRYEHEIQALKEENQALKKENLELQRLQNQSWSAWLSECLRITPKQ